MEGLTASDVALMQKDTNDWGGGSFMWIFALLILLLVGGGGLFGNSGQAVTEAGLCNAMNFNGLENAVGRLNDSLQADYMGLQNGLCNLGYETLKNFNDTQKSIADVNINLLTQSNAIQALNNANTQKILDVLSTNRIADMQNQINQLQLQNAMCGVVRYPTQTSYCSGANPFASGCCNV